MLNEKAKKTTPVYIETDKKINNSNINSAVIIPALNPMPTLIYFIKTLLADGVPQIIVVNDGSDTSFNDIFRKVSQLKHCTVLNHGTNHGKGRALKTAFAYFIDHYSYLDGVVTADADGKYNVNDILGICERLSLNQNFLILGVRNLNENNSPKLKYMSNLLATRIFQLLYGSNLEDTQTGLRGIPGNELIWMLQMNGERYEYEMNMLIKSSHHNLSFLTVPINSMYLYNNLGSYYSTVKDSFSIFISLISGFIQYSGSTLVTAFFDVLSFFLLNSIVLTSLSASVRIFLSTAIASFVASIFNFLMNRKLVFADKSKLSSSAVRYCIIWILQMLICYSLVYSVSMYYKINALIIKILVDSISSVVNYQIQLRWIFSSKDNTDSSSQ